MLLDEDTDVCCHVKCARWNGNVTLFFICICDFESNSIDIHADFESKKIL